MIEWINLFGAPLRYYRDNRQVGVFGLFEQLANFNGQVYEYGVTGPIFLALCLVIIVGAIFAFLQVIKLGLRYLNYSEAEISVIQTKLILTFPDDSLIKSITERKQLFHANKRGTSAYFLEHATTSPSGVIVDGTFDSRSYLNGQLITKSLEIHGNRNKIEIIEMFNRDLPTDWFATYLPDNIVMNMYKARLGFRNTIVSRHTTITNENEYIGEKPTIQLQSIRYPASNVVIEIRFPMEAAPERSDMRCFRIRANAVEELTPECVVDGLIQVFRIEVTNLYKERLRLTWTNRNLQLASPTARIQP